MVGPRLGRHHHVLSLGARLCSCPSCVWITTGRRAFLLSSWEGQPVLQLGQRPSAASDQGEGIKTRPSMAVTMAVPGGQGRAGGESRGFSLGWRWQPGWPQKQARLPLLTLWAASLRGRRSVSIGDLSTPAAPRVDVLTPSFPQDVLESKNSTIKDLQYNMLK